MSRFADVTIFFFFLPSLIHFTCCAPLVKRSGGAPCLADKDCLVAQKCYWSTWADEPTGRCRFAFPQKPIRGFGNLHIGHRWRIKRSYDEGTDPGQNVQLQTSDTIGMPPPAQIPARVDEFPPGGINGPPIEGPPREIPEVPPNRYDRPVPVIGPAPPDSTRRREEAPGIQRLIHNRHSKTHTTRAPRPEIATPAFDFDVNDDNWGETFRLNNDNDINLFHVPTRGYGQRGNLPGAWGRQSGRVLPGDNTRSSGGDSLHSSSYVANGMEDDVDFADEVAHDPSELKAASEGAAIRAGYDIPQTHKGHRHRYRQQEEQEQRQQEQRRQQEQPPQQQQQQQQQQRQRWQYPNNARAMTANRRRRPRP